MTEARRSTKLVEVVEELRAVKNRLFTLELTLLERETTRKAKAAAKQAPDELEAAEAKRKVEEESDRQRLKLEEKFKHLEDGLYALSDLTVRAGEIEEKQRKLEDLAQAFQEQKQQMDSERAQIVARMQELDRRLADSDVAERAQVIDVTEADLKERVAAFQEEMTQLVRMRDELNRDFDNMGRMKAEFEAEREAFEEEKKGKGGKNSGKGAGGDPEEFIRKLVEGFEKMVREMVKK